MKNGVPLYYFMIYKNNKKVKSSNPRLNADICFVTSRKNTFRI